MRVLACVSVQAQARLRNVFAADEAYFPATVEEALRALTHVEFDFVLIGMLFDESRGLDLMEKITQNSTFAQVPVVGVTGRRVKRAVLQTAFEVPMRTLGARDIVDVAAIPDDIPGNRILRERLLACAR